MVEPQLLERFKKLLNETEATAVVASTWRHNPEAMRDARRLDIPFDDVLPDLRPQSRAKEVEAWLHGHAHSGRFAIIDDDDDGYGSFPLFQPDPTEGLTDEVARAVLLYLRGERNRDLRRSIFVRMFQRCQSLILGHRG